MSKWHWAEWGVRFSPSTSVFLCKLSLHQYPTRIHHSADSGAIRGHSFTEI